ncbi:MAG: M67 family peptidase [Methanobacteriota archaeon]|nr:MAG: M67 family peptidase [Euryarchaeota archaeon]
MICFTEKALRDIKNHGYREAPKEACGILAGAPGTKAVSRIFPCANVDDNPLSAYTIEPEELLRRITEIEDSHELELIGFYHSHPFSAPMPSTVDVERATWDGFCYAIYSLTEDEVRCWRWNEAEGRFTEEDVRIM